MAKLIHMMLPLFCYFCPHAALVPFANRRWGKPDDPWGPRTKRTRAHFDHPVILECRIETTTDRFPENTESLPKDCVYLQAGMQCNVVPSITSFPFDRRTHFIHAGQPPG